MVMAVLGAWGLGGAALVAAYVASRTLPTLMEAAPNRSTVTGGRRMPCPDLRAGPEPDEPHDTGPYPRAEHEAVAQAPGASGVRLMAYPSQGAPAASWLDTAGFCGRSQDAVCHATFCT